MHGAARAGLCPFSPRRQQPALAALQRPAAAGPGCRTARARARPLPPPPPRRAPQAGRARVRAMFARHDVIDDYDAPSDVARMHGVKAVPCFLFFDGGALVSRLTLRDVRRMRGPAPMVRACARGQGWGAVRRGAGAGGGSAHARLGSPRPRPPSPTDPRSRPPWRRTCRASARPSGACCSRPRPARATDAAASPRSSCDKRRRRRAPRGPRSAAPAAPATGARALGPSCAAAAHSVPPAHPPMCHHFTAPKQAPRLQYPSCPPHRAGRRAPRRAPIRRPRAPLLYHAPPAAARPHPPQGAAHLPAAPSPMTPCAAPRAAATARRPPPAPPPPN
jgi:hypothetical protein